MSKQQKSSLKDSALHIFLFMYMASWCLWATDAAIAGPMGYNMHWNGHDIGEVTSGIISDINAQQLVNSAKAASGTMDTTNTIESVVKYLELYTYLVMDFITMLLGLKVFELLYVLGMPAEFVGLIQVVYVILAAYALMHYMPKIAKVVQTVLLVTQQIGQTARIIRGVP